ncbi:hypothetical protein OSCI_1140012 [Kamptonema sp. PCC 6506]|nr:hypothetical protein OSCI_1140012 [Kamptonema sp. PCC 6506]
MILSKHIQEYCDLGAVNSNFHPPQDSVQVYLTLELGELFP